MNAKPCEGAANGTGTWQPVRILKYATRAAAGKGGDHVARQGI